MTPSMAVLCRLGLAVPAPVGPRPVRRRQPVLRWLGLAQAPVRIGGHPRIRERLLVVQARRRRADEMLLVSVGVLVLLTMLVAGVVRSPLMAVDRVAVRGLDDAQRSLVEQHVGVAAGTNVLDVDLRGVAAGVEALPWVARATVTRRLPSTIDIRVGVRRAVATATYGGLTYLIDADGIVIDQTDGQVVPVAAGTVPDRLPEVPLAQAPVLGAVVEESAVRTAVAVAGAMPPGVAEWVVAYRATPTGEIDATLRIPTSAGPAEVVVHLGRPDDIRDKAATVAALVHETIGRGMPLRVLDVRIPDRPVVRT